MNNDNIPSQRVPRSTPVTHSPQSLTAKDHSPAEVCPNSFIDWANELDHELHARRGKESSESSEAPFGGALKAKLGWRGGNC